jgi:predicted Zn-dependent protease
MSGKGDIKKFGETSFKDTSSVGLINYILGYHGRIASNINTHDTWPNVDGDVGITENDQPIGVWRTQVKTLPKDHGGKYDIPVGIYKYVKQMGQPILVLLPDINDQRVYWKYIDEDVANATSYTAKQQTKSINLTKRNSFTIKEKRYIDDWVKITKDRISTLEKMHSALTELTSKEIARSKDLLDKGQTSEALELLQKLFEEKKESLSSNELFRIMTNIGYAQHHLGNNTEAIKCFYEAYKNESSSDKAKVNIALAYMLEGKTDKALRMVNAVLRVNPIDPNAASIKIRAMHELGKTYKAILKSLDNTVLESVEALHALSYVTRDTDPDESIRLLEKAAEKDSSDINIRADLGIALMQRVESKWAGKIRGELNAQDRESIQRGIDHLEYAWKQQRTPEDKKARQSWLFNIIVGYRFLKNDCVLENSLKELVDLDPENKTNIQQAAAIAVESGKYELAESYLMSSSLGTEKSNELALMLSDSLILQSKYDEALVLLQSILPKLADDSSMIEHATSNIFKAFIDTGKLDEALRLADNTSQNQTNESLAKLFYSRLAAVQQDTSRAIQLIHEAAATLPQEPSKSLMYGIANDAFELKEYTLAADIYERIMDTSADSVETRKYLHALYEAKRYNTLIDRVLTLKNNGFKAKQVLRFEWLAYIALQDLKRARKALASYVKADPSDEDERLSIALIDFRTHNTRALNSYLSSDINLEKLDEASLTQIAHLYRTRGMLPRMLYVAYELRRRFIDSPDAHSTYIGLLLGLGNAGKKFLDADKAGPNTALIYDGGFFIIEADYPPSINNHEISVEDAARRGFIGKKKGDQIVLSRNRLSGERTTQIIEVQTKYVHALQDSMKNYEQRFVDRSDLMGFNIEDKDFTPLFKQVDETYSNALAVEELYKSGKLTIDLFAESVGKNIIEVVYALRNTPQLGVRASMGSSSEMDSLNAAMKQMKNPRFVMDIVALINFYELSIDVNSIGLDKFKISQSTKDLIIQEAAKLESEANQQGATIYKQGDSYIRQEVTTKERRQRVKNIHALIRWVNRNTEVMPFDEALLTKVANNKKLSGLENALLDSQMDTMKLATNNQTILYTDDVGIGSLAKEVFGTQYIWTQALLGYSVRNQNLDLISYGKLSIKLAEANLHHLGISPVILLQSILISEEGAFESSLYALTRKEVEVTSMAKVIVQFIELAVARGLSDRIKELLPVILEHAAQFHDKEHVIDLIKEGIEVTLMSLGGERDKLTMEIERWMNENQ